MKNSDINDDVIELGSVSQETKGQAAFEQDDGGGKLRNSIGIVLD